MLKPFAIIVGLAGLSGCQSFPAVNEASLRETIVPDGWEQSYNDFRYAPAVRAGDYVYLSGLVASIEDEDGRRTEEEAYESAFREIERILRVAGIDWGDVIEMTTYHTDLVAQAEAFTAVKDRYITEPYPAWTAIDIDRLWPERGLVEIRVVAYDPR